MRSAYERGAYGNPVAACATSKPKQTQGGGGREGGGRATAPPPSTGRV
jgi:hypothetical protein